MPRPPGRTINTECIGGHLQLDDDDVGRGIPTLLPMRVCASELDRIAGLELTHQDLPVGQGDAAPEWRQRMEDGGRMVMLPCHVAGTVVVFEYPDLRILENYMVSVAVGKHRICAVAAGDNTMPGQQGRLVSHALTPQRIAMARSPPEARPVPRSTR